MPALNDIQLDEIQTTLLMLSDQQKQRDLLASKKLGEQAEGQHLAIVAQILRNSGVEPTEEGYGQWEQKIVDNKVHLVRVVNAEVIA